MQHMHAVCAFLCMYDTVLPWPVQQVSNKLSCCRFVLCMAVYMSRVLMGACSVLEKNERVQYEARHTRPGNPDAKQAAAAQVCRMLY